MSGLVHRLIDSQNARLPEFKVEFLRKLAVYRSGLRHQSAYALAMPSQLHEVLLLLFRNRPELAPELLREAMHMELPRYTQARIDCAELNEVQPTEYRADLVVLLLDEVPVLGIVVEAQLAADPRKRFVWPVYVTSLRAQARADPELAVLSAMAHGRDADTATSVQIALAVQLASEGLDAISPIWNRCASGMPDSAGGGLALRCSGIG